MIAVVVVVVVVVVVIIIILSTKINVKSFFTFPFYLFFAEGGGKLVCYYQVDIEMNRCNK